MLRILSLALVLVASSALGQATPETEEAPLDQDAPQSVEGPMTLERMSQIVLAIDPQAQFFGRNMQLAIQDVPIMIISDPIADRMRAMVPIRSASGLDAAEMMRLMQANFDTALDARYAVAQGRLWAVFIHPLSPLEKNQFISGLVQTVSIAQTYGTAYSGGAMQFGGGDSGRIYRELLEELQKRGEEI